MIQRIISVWAAIALLGAVVLAVVFAILWGHGFGSRSEPSNMEANIAMKALDSSIPARYGKMSNPLAEDKINLVEAGGHYQEHCAACHGDSGSGDPKFHGIMSPRPTDLRSQETQEMSDGELYWVIKNGIRWSGMPAFGKPGDSDEHAWKMVSYVRHLPKLTPAEAQRVLQQTEMPMNHGAP
jgi:mono/diheme cytochrome c family protein